MSDKKYFFDLSDGFGKADIFAILVAIGSLIAFFFKVIFYPYVWILRMFGRSFRFARSKDTVDSPLSEDQRMFMESIPTFFILVGVFMGVLIAIFIGFVGSDAVERFLESLSLDTLIQSVGWWLTLFLEIILWIIGLDTGTGENKIYRFGIVDIIRGIFEIILAIFSSDPVLLFFGIGLVGIAIAAVWILVSETGIVSGLITVTTSVTKFLIFAPRRVYNRANAIYLGFNRRLGAIVLGDTRLGMYTVGFHRKILLYSLGLGIWTFLGGLFVLASNPFSDVSFQIGFVLIVLLFFGLGVGIIEIFLIVRFLDTVSRGKYSTLSKAE